jgi:uncharacterized phage-associated protein
MTYDPRSIANYFIDLAVAEGKQVSPLKLIKLVYIAHGWHLALTGKPLINDPPEAWKYGPVIPSLYHELKIYGNEPVAAKIRDFELAPGPEIGFNYVEIQPPDENIKKFLQSIWKAYGHFSGLQLSALTHQPNTPWHHTWEKEGAKYSKGADIPEALIREHYLELKAKNDARTAAEAAQ